MPLSNVIKAVIIDIDGCLTSKTFGQPLDLEPLTQIQEISRSYLSDPAVPIIILNTGRDANHTELMAKILDAFNYFIIEMGAAVVSIRGAQLNYKLHKEITPEALQTFEKLQREYLKTYPQYEKYLQYGKRYMITFLFEVGDPVKKQCLTDLQAFTKAKEYNFHIDEGHNFINIIFPNINKGSGLDLLFELNSEFTRNNIAGIGDSTGDWEFLKFCAFSGCPANGSDILKEKCDYVAANYEAVGTLEIIRYIIKRNRYFLEQAKKSQKRPKGPINAMITDINGTIDSAIFGKSLDLAEIKKIRSLIQQSKKDPIVPKIILNTGWDLNYTMLYAQLLDDLQYHVIERGAAIVAIDGPFVKIQTDPKITSEVINDIADLQAGFIRKHPHFYRHLQVGKKYMMSFQFEVGSSEKDDCLDNIKEFMTEKKINYDIEDGPNYINVGVAGIDKGTGAELLLKTVTDLKFEKMVGVGDSDGDWSFMSKCGFTACPSNASRFLREHCDYIASKPETEGTLEIIEQIIQWNIDLDIKTKKYF